MMQVFRVELQGGLKLFLWLEKKETWILRMKMHLMQEKNGASSGGEGDAPRRGLQLSKESAIQSSLKNMICLQIPWS
jgi:hypothetical protein